MSQQSEVVAITEPVIERLGYELVHVQVSGTGSRRKVAVFIDKDGGVNVEDCAVVSREIDPLIEEDEVFHDSYTLEVSSPGLERPLFRARDFERFSGRKAKVSLHRPVTGNRKNYTGIIEGVRDGETLLIEVDGEQEEIPLDLVRKANLVFEWKKNK